MLPLTYRPVVDRFAMPVPLDPLSAAFFVAALVAAAALTARRPVYGLAALVLTTPVAFAHDALGTTITLPKAVLLGVLLGLSTYRGCAEVAAKPSSTAAHRGALAALRGHRAHAARCFQSRARHPRNAQDRRVCGILRCGVPLLHARPRRRAPGRRGGDCGDGRRAVGARSRNRRRAVRTLHRASHRPAHRRPPRRAEPAFGLLRDRRSDARRLGARSILGAR